MHKKQITILLADDDEDDRELLKRAFQEIDPTIIIIPSWNGEQIIDYLTGCDVDKFPSLIVLDFNMPLLNGLEVLVKIGRDELYSTIPKVVFSTSNSPLHVTLCTQAGANKYFVKPHGKEELLKIAKEMIEVCE